LAQSRPAARSFRLPQARHSGLQARFHVDQIQRLIQTDPPGDSADGLFYLLAHPASDYATPQARDGPAWAGRRLPTEYFGVDNPDVTRR
jgi:hypothetical protein